MSGCFSGVSINYIKKERLSFIYLESVTASRKQTEQFFLS